MHIADFQRKEIKNDDFLPTWEIYFIIIIAAQMSSKSSRAEQKS